MPSRRHRWGWYGLAAWKRRRRHQLRTEPLCKYCRAVGMAVPATHVDHVVPHHGDYNLFVTSELQSLCIHCHNKTKHIEELHGYTHACGFDGWPTDPRHPSNATTPRV
jgi:5-methylcytosine-specific restriction protein A